MAAGSRSVKYCLSASGGDLPNCLEMGAPSSRKLGPCIMRRIRASSQALLNGGPRDGLSTALLKCQEWEALQVLLPGLGWGEAWHR